MTTTQFQLQLIVLISVVLKVSCQTEDPAAPTEEETGISNHLNVSAIWGYGFLAGFGISLIGFLTALIIVCIKKISSDGCFEMTIKFLFSLAFGALLGDAMIHILPEAYTVEGSDPRVVAGIFIGSILFFLILERLFHTCGITHQHWHSNDCHDDHQGAIQNHNHPNKIHNEEHLGSNQDGTTHPNHGSNNMIIEENLPVGHKCKSNHDHSHGPQHKHEHSEGHEHAAHCDEHDHSHTTEEVKDEDKNCFENLKGKGTAGYMNLLGSVIHNFMDGLALGVAFATGNPKTFIPVLIAIIAHEIPREMGDVAILMTNNFNGVQTVLCNGFVNLLALLGVIIGLAITDLSDVAKEYILVFVAGNFIFIAADIWRYLFKNSGFTKNLVEFLGFGLGVSAMYLVLLLESDEKEH